MKVKIEFSVDNADFDDNGMLTSEWYQRQLKRLRVYQGANGLWYAAAERDDGFHRQGVGRHASAREALNAARRRLCGYREE